MISDFELAALTLSFKVAIWATLLSLPVAILVAHVMARRTFAGKTALEVLLHAPLVVPPVVIGYILLVTLAPNTAFGAWLESIGLSPAFKWQGAALASGLMAFPLMVRAIRQAFEAEPKTYREVALTLGASPWRTFWRISLPLALPGILSATALGFARAVGEFGATITFVANIPGLTQTLPLALYSAAQSPGGEAAAARLALLCLVPAIGSLAVSEWLSRRARRKRGLA
ncbi:molybdate ABC transporter permease subunit [Kordiimonas gwangyangensis]|uniref:molybdate ABC transporter permease subunit n=1 Tax=Kordiimonas gwangyangensis TaxID=288022 RepID=UPI00037DE9A7|nr:molybdate ABC transporter permease subunit [Kordiimonas gwangyangensis]